MIIDEGKVRLQNWVVSKEEEEKYFLELGLGFIEKEEGVRGLLKQNAISISSSLTHSLEVAEMREREGGRERERGLSE